MPFLRADGHDTTGQEADSATPVQTATIRTSSASDDDHDLNSDSDIDRNGVNADEARARFLGATVDARDVNFSDSIAAKRKAYRIKNRRRHRRRAADGSEEVGDLSDSEDESFERKLARLRREVEEAKEELAARHAQTIGESRELEEDDPDGDGLLELSRAVDGLYVATRGHGSHTTGTVLAQKIAAGIPAEQASADSSQDETTLARQTMSTPPTAGGILAHAAAFDTRLALIEAAMGIPQSASNPFTAVADVSSSEPALQPVLPALERLTSRLTTLTSLLVGPSAATSVTSTTTAMPTSSATTNLTMFTTPHLEFLSTRVRKLTADAEALASARKRALDAAKAAQAARLATGSNTSNAAFDPSLPSDISISSSSATAEVDQNNNAGINALNDPAAAQRDEQTAKIHALYAALPTIQSLHPLLPSVLERLRSLRAIHAGAARAAESLDELEKRQAEMKKEIDQWREGLKVVEEKMSQGETALKNNIEVVEPWVRDLERRVGQLGL